MFHIIPDNYDFSKPHLGAVAPERFGQSGLPTQFFWGSEIFLLRLW
jgi:hypothetical protein